MSRHKVFKYCAKQKMPSNVLDTKKTSNIIDIKDMSNIVDTKISSDVFDKKDNNQYPRHKREE